MLPFSNKREEFFFVGGGGFSLFFMLPEFPKWVKKKKLKYFSQNLHFCFLLAESRLLFSPRDFEKFRIPTPLTTSVFSLQIFNKILTVKRKTTWYFEENILNPDENIFIL